MPEPPADFFERPKPWERKAWGWTRLAVQSEVYQRHELVVEAGGYCSRHYHMDRANHFRVLSGLLTVEVWWDERRKVTHTLRAGQTLDIPSLVQHRFTVLEPGRVIEEYWADRGGTVRSDDIVRLDTGGKR